MNIKGNRFSAERWEDDTKGTKNASEFDRTAA